jgi:hypothetical protein
MKNKAIRDRRFFKHFFLSCILSVFLHINLFSQTGPGGVGSSTSNVLWLEADAITSLADGNDITTWTDGSGNTNDVSQPNASFKPIYKTNILNGFPAVRFNKTNGRIRKNGFTTFPTTAITEIYVNINSESSDGILSYATGANNNDFLLFNSNNLRIYRASNVVSGLSFNDNNFHIVNASWRSSDGSAEIWKDGIQAYTTTGHQTGTSITTGGCFAIAGEQDAVDGIYQSSQAHFGDFTEVMVFNTYLNTAQHIIVTNYLAAKYNLTIANDLFAYQANHSFDVAGIGREDATNNHTAAMSANVLQVQNASGLNANQEYLLFGHDNADITNAWTTTEAPNAGTDIQRLAREWRLDETGDVGTVDFLLDVAALPALPAGHTMYALMVDADGDFSNGSSVYELGFVAGTTYDASGVTINDGDFVAISAVRPKVEHTLAISNGFEPNNAVIGISLNFISRTAKTVDFTTADGTALVAQPDYTGTAGTTVTIPAGSSTANYTVLVTNDVIVEPSETFIITLSNPSAGVTLGTNIVHTYTLQDDDNTRKVYYNLTSSSGGEATSAATITLSINNVDLVNPTTIDYSVTGGTATGIGTDYTLATGTVTFLKGETNSSLDITIIDDIISENNETIIITLSNPTNCNADGLAPFGGTGFVTHTYTIIDNDVSTMQFNTTVSSGLESFSPVSFQVDLDVVSSIDASATYTLTGSATGSGTDYTLANGTVTISAGNTTTNIMATIVDDAIEELSETIIITLSVPVDATLGANTLYTYSIIDNDEFGYLGPGGVGKAANNKIWVKSNDLPVLADGSNITTWVDASGNSNDLSQGNTSFKPRYFSNILNGQPVVRFNRSNGRLIHNNFNDFPTSAITTIFVNSNNDSNDGIVSYASSSALNNDYLLYNSNGVAFYRGGAIGTGTAINSNTFRIIGNTWQGSNGATRFYSNGTQTFAGTHATGTQITAGGNLAIAGEQDAVDGAYQANQSHQGDFTEIIMYNVVLNSARRKIVDNYLSAKYNIAITNDLFTYDAPNTYENEVTGIGCDDATNFHHDAQGKAMVRINTASSLGNGDYLFWGHNNASFTLSNTVDVPIGIDNRLERVWRVDETGNIGTVTVDVDLSSFTIGNSNDLVLLIDSDDGSFANAAQFPISSFAGKIATFNNINFAAGNWFTTASLGNSNPLPIVLISFEATANEDNVDLKWVTATEINSDFFTLERSSDAKNWEEIITTNGAGNANQVLEYFETDFEPLEGVSYYRLKQTDFDGQYEYFNIVTVRFKNNNLTKNMSLFPNPVYLGGIVQVEFKDIFESDFLVVLRNISGRKFYSKMDRNIENGIVVEIPIDIEIPAGVYLITATSENQTYSQKLIIK